MAEKFITYENTISQTLYEEMYKKLIDKRIIYLNNDIDDSTLDLVGMPIILRNIEEQDIPENELEPLTIFLNSYGGSADACLHLIEVIEKSRIPINCRVLSIAASAGLYIAIACKHRIASENSIFLLHKGSIQISGNMGEAEEIMGFYKEEVQAKFDELVINKTKITKNELKKMRRNETYCLGLDALNKYGFVDEII